MLNRFKNSQHRCVNDMCILRLSKHGIRLSSTMQDVARCISFSSARGESFRVNVEFYVEFSHGRKR